MSGKRDAWLASSDELFLRDCETDFFRASGKGGQKVNKTSSAARLTHRPSGISASSQESRSQTENRLKALRALKFRMALELREEASPPPVLEPVPSRSNDAYPLYVARLLDVVAKAGGDLKAAAAALDVNRSRLERLLRHDPAVWTFYLTRLKARREDPESGDGASA
jgi:hypothetical protein